MSSSGDALLAQLEDALADEARLAVLVRGTRPAAARSPSRLARAQASSCSFSRARSMIALARSRIGCVER